jgi:hypothetical protein
MEDDSGAEGCITLHRSRRRVWNALRGAPESRGRHKVIVARHVDRIGSLMPVMFIGGGAWARRIWCIADLGDGRQVEAGCPVVGRTHDRRTVGRIGGRA